MMPSRGRFAAAGAALIGALAAGPSFAACKAEQAWRHEHAGEKSNVETTDVKGTRKTTIEICRAADPSGDALTVQVTFEGSRGFKELPSADCVDRFAKWAVVKSTGARTGTGGPAVAQGTYKICTD